MKKYYCDVCEKAVPNMCDRNKIKLTECWDNTTYKKLLCNDCFNKIMNFLRGVENEKTD